MDTTTLDTAVIGAGAAGLRTARLLAERGVDFEIIDGHDRVGDAWRERYHSLRLFTPRRWAELPGMRMGIGFFDYPTGTQFADYLEQCAAAIGARMRLSTRVERLSLTADGRFGLGLSTGDEVVASRVVVAAGAHERPILPPFAADLDPAIHALHSLAYRGPEDFAPGPVLVVGAANSGTDIALEAAASGHDVTLAGRHPGQVPVSIDTRVGNLMSSIFIRRLRGLTLDTERGRRFAAANREPRAQPPRRPRHGGRAPGGSRHGSRRRGPADARGRGASGCRNVVWCTGSLPDLHWVDIPAAFDERGDVAQVRGIATNVAGLAFVGLPFQYSVASPTLMGMERDAVHVVSRLFEPSRAARAAASVAA